MTRRLGGYLVAIAAAGCASAPCPEPARAQVVPARAQVVPTPAPVRAPDWVALEQAAIDPSLPRCDAEPIPFDRPCRVVAIYTLSAFHTKNSRVFTVWPVFVMADGRSGLVGNFWYPAELPDRETLARYEGKRVEIAGVLNSEPPREKPEYKQNMMIPSLWPVHAIRILGDAP